MEKKGLYHSLVTTQMAAKEETEEKVKEKDEDEVVMASDTLEDLNLDDAERPSLMSIGSFSDTFGRKKSGIERRISVLSNYSTYSEESFGIENALGAATSAIAIARAGSTRTSRRRSKSVVQQQSVEAENEEVVVAEELLQVDTARIARMNAPEWPYVLVGLLGAIVMGGAMPVYAILFGEVLGVLKLSSEEARAQSVYFSGLFMAAGVTAGIAVFLQVTMFSIAGERLTQRMRRLAFAAMLRQEMGWYDQPENSVGSLLSRLSADSSAIQGATGSRVGAILHASFTLILSVITSLILEWRLGLVGCAFVPLVLIATFAQSKIVMGHDNVEKKALGKANKLAIEAISNIRTVASLRKEEYFVEAYNKELAGPHQSNTSRSHLRGIVFGFAQSMPFFAYGGCMFYGGYLVYSEHLPYKIVFTVAEALLLGTMMVGQATAFAPNYSKAMIAAARVFNLLDRKPKIDSAAGSGLRLNQVEGNAEIKDAVFSYPTRPGVKVGRY
jgi:ATP-binding cassette subfamily B (MDR/TAP) protein 1